MSVIDFEPKVEGEIGRIEDSDDLTEKDKETLLEYVRECDERGVVELEKQDGEIRVKITEKGEMRVN